jgi:DNA-directed RNA polymerase specialized sigma24 family protein
MPELTDVDHLVARAQRGDAAALDAVCARVRPLLVRHVRRLLGRTADVEDAVQEALMVIAARIGTYRWEGSFAGWVYAVATRSLLRRAASAPDEAALSVEVADAALVTDHDPMTEAEWLLVEQDLHLACTVGVLTGLAPEAPALSAGRGARGAGPDRSTGRSGHARHLPQTTRARAPGGRGRGARHGPGLRGRPTADGRRPRARRPRATRRAASRACPWGNRGRSGPRAGPGRADARGLSSGGRRAALRL